MKRACNPGSARLSFLLRGLVCATLLAGITAAARAPHKTPRKVEPAFIAHEWGTFTSIVANNGRAIEWLPLSASSDLPSFVEHLRTTDFKGGLRGTIRMETPVLYFYSSREISLSVQVSFVKGLITEWYPHANRVEPAGNVTDISFSRDGATGKLGWDLLTLAPNPSPEFRRERNISNYYAARETAATPIRIATASGEQREKFLFYRGVSTAALPVLAKLLANGDLQVDNLASQSIPAAILFERRGSKISYAIVTALGHQYVFTTPSPAGTLEALRSDMERILISQGLYPDEARAMLETWRDSWFGEGSRLFYVVPRSFVDAAVPLSIQPAPAETVRVFVGRIEIVSQATQRDVERAFASKDKVTMAKYGRFLEPILQIMYENEYNLDPRSKRLTLLHNFMDAFYSSLSAPSA